MIFPPAPPHQAAGRAASSPSQRPASLLRAAFQKIAYVYPQRRKSYPQFHGKKQAKWAKFSVLSRISLFHRQENLRKGLTTDWKSVNIHIDHIRVIWRIRIILSAGAGRVRREERRPRLLSSGSNAKKGSRRPCTVAFCLAFASGFVPCGGRGEGCGPCVCLISRKERKVSGSSPGGKAAGQFGDGFAIFAKSCHILRRNA